MTLLLVRTGDTSWDREERIVGAVDLPLADTVADTTVTVSPAVVLCGPDECSRASAEALAARHGPKVRPLEGLADVGMGLWEGVTFDELRERCPSAFKQWRDRPDSISVPEGESLSDATERICAEIHRAAMKVKGDHPVVMAVLRPMAFGLVRALLLGRDDSDLWNVVETAPEGVETFEVPPGLLSPGPRRISA
ncbi:MAG: histidine phosphatase family protein [Phycisphaerales bacterium JB040]